MRLASLFCLILMGTITTIAQSLQDLSFGTDQTLEIITWNIEHFPKNGSTTTTAVKQIIESLNADVYALQEIDEPAQLDALVNNLPGYSVYHESVYYGGLAYVYKTSTVQVKGLYEIYTSTTEAYRYNFPRKPMVMEMTFKGEEYIIINNHFKCCGDGTLEKNDTYDEEYKRYTATNMLKDYIDHHFADQNVIVVGDLNDILTDASPDNVFQTVLNDPDNYQFADQLIAEGNSNNWSYPSWPSHLDHILITNELFDDLERPGSTIQTIRVDDYLSGGFSAYDRAIADHRPVALKLLPDVSNNIWDLTAILPNFYNYPNPVIQNTVFIFDAIDQKSLLKIYNPGGQLIETIAIEAGEESYEWQPRNQPAGIYLAVRIVNKQPAAVAKLKIQ